MRLEPKQDWMILDPLKKKGSGIIIPDSVDVMSVDKRPELQAFKVLDVGPWDKDLNGHEHGVKKDDVVMIEGLSFAMLEIGDKKYAVSRAGNVIYSLIGDMNHLTSINNKEGGKDGGN